jgi:hypothetical protein
MNYSLLTLGLLTIAGIAVTEDTPLEKDTLFTIFGS